MDSLIQSKKTFIKNENKVKKVLLDKKKTSFVYKSYDVLDIEKKLLNDKWELFDRLSLKINNCNLIKELGTILDDYKIQRKKEIPLKIITTEDVLKNVDWLKNEKQENLILLTLDWWNKIISKILITKWLIDQSLIHPREVFAPAIKDMAKSIIIVHNHPGWDYNPSLEDHNITHRLKKVSEIVWIKFLDHIIVSSVGHYSFNKENIL